MPLYRGSRSILDRAPRHFAEAIIREILSLPFFDGLQNETSDEFGRVTLAVIGRRSAAGRIPHPVLFKNSIRLTLLVRQLVSL